MAWVQSAYCILRLRRLSRTKHHFRTFSFIIISSSCCSNLREVSIIKRDGAARCRPMFIITLPIRCHAMLILASSPLEYRLSLIQCHSARAGGISWLIETTTRLRTAGTCCCPSFHLVYVTPVCLLSCTSLRRACRDVAGTSTLANDRQSQQVLAAGVETTRDVKVILQRMVSSDDVQWSWFYWSHLERSSAIIG